METKITKLDGCRKEIEIKANLTDIQPQIDKAYAETMPHIEIKGFRKGKAPLQMVKKLYGRRIETDALQDAAVELFNKACKEQDMKFLGQPMITKIEQNEDNYTFVIVFEDMPEFQLADYKGLVIDEPVHPVTDEEIQSVIDEACLINGESVTADEISDMNCEAEITMVQLDEATNTPLINGIGDSFKVSLREPNLFAEMKDALLYKKPGDEFTVALPKAPGSEDKNMFKCTVNTAFKRVPAAFDEELVKKISDGKFEAVQDYRDEIGFRLQETWNRKSRNYMQNEIVNKLIEMHEFSVPESLVRALMENELHELKHRLGIPDDSPRFTVDAFQEHLRPKAEGQAKWLVLKERIIEAEKLEVEEHDLEEAAEQEALRSGLDAETLRKEIDKNEDYKGFILTKKLFDFILDFAVTNEIEFPAEEAVNPYELDDDIEDYEEDDHECGPDCDHDHNH